QDVWQRRRRPILGFHVFLEFRARVQDLLALDGELRRDERRTLDDRHRRRVNQVEIADLFARCSVTIDHKNACTALDLLNRLEKFVGTAIEVVPDQLDLGDSYNKKQHTQSQEDVSKRAISKVDVKKSHKHKRNRNRQALVREMRAEQGARQGKIGNAADGENGPAGCIELQDAAPERIDTPGRSRCKKEPGDCEIVDIENSDEALQLAAELPKRR